MIRAIRRRVTHHGNRLKRRLDNLRAAQMAARRNGRGILELAAESERLLRDHGISDRALRGFGLDVDSMSFENKTKYLPTEWDAQLRMWQMFVPEHRRALFHNKYLFHRFFKAEGLPVARMYGILDAENGRLENGQPFSTPAQLRSWMRSTGDDGPPSKGFVIKPVEGYKGHGVFVFEERLHGDLECFLTLDGRTMSAEDVYKATAGNPEIRNLGRQMHTRSFLIEERLAPHADLEDLIGPTLCTVRIVTFIARDGSPRILGAYLRMQSDRSGVDHTSRGAVGAWVDAQTGVLRNGRSRFSTEIIETIPGTDRRYEGFVVPFWSNVKSVAETAQLAFPWAKSIGWDIGITDRGPYLVEGNSWWSMSGLQHAAPYGLLQDEFKAISEELRAAK